MLGLCKDHLFLYLSYSSFEKKTKKAVKRVSDPC